MPESIKLFKKRLYWFIHHCFAHWPLDPTFRFVSNCGEDITVRALLPWLVPQLNVLL